jgi:tetratricopeptide (TPR) repeat protein
MKIAILPFNVTEGVKPALGRQISNIVAEAVRNSTKADIQAISYLAETEQDGVRRVTHVNVGTGFSEYEMFTPLFRDSQVDKIVHGFLTTEDGKYKLSLRVNVKESEEPVFESEDTFGNSEIFEELTKLIRIVAEQAETEVTDPAAVVQLGTHNPEAFVKFMEGFDGFQYIQQTNGAVTTDFNPSEVMSLLAEAIEMDPDFPAPFDVTIQLCRACAAYRVGSFEDCEKTLVKLTGIRPDDYRPYAALGEIYQTVGNFPRAGDSYEKAISLHLQLGDEIVDEQMQERAALYSRLGLAQMSIGMPVNAEANFRKAIQMEVGEKPSLDLLANVLAQTQRHHEIPTIWKQEAELNPQNGIARAKYAGSLAQLGRREEAVAAFEAALVELEESSFVKRFYAPLLVQSGELDRAMDFYEDCLDVAPNDVPLMIEYANTLKEADREFEIPAVLKNILSSNPDSNIRAQTLAWLVELEQPKRAEAVAEAQTKMEAEDFDGVIKSLKPLRNWLADYWKLWALLSAAYNRLNMHAEAEEAANKLLNLFPGYEPGYGELMSALTNSGRNEEAYNVMRHAANNVPTSLGIHVNLALAAKRAGHEDEARALAKQIREAVGANEELEPVLAEIES